MRVAVTVAVYNEEKHIADLLTALLKQTRMPDEIVVVDDGSCDRSGDIVRSFCCDHHQVRYLAQPNSGPAAARNVAWRLTDADICVFTDGDCVPHPDWLERLLAPLADPDVAASAGTYSTINDHRLLAKFVGLEIAWKYRRVSGRVDAHGAYNLAVRRSVLVEIGGFDESYRAASGEDWDMTYKISRRHAIVFVPQAVVGHHHPERLWPYLRGQVRRGMDRIKLYKDHPQKRRGDVYTPWYVKYQVVMTGALLPSLLLMYPLFPYSWLVPLGLLTALLAIAALPFVYYWRRDRRVACYSIIVQLLRNMAWFIGLVRGVWKFGL